MTSTLSNNAFYSADIQSFLTTTENDIVGQLARDNSASFHATQGTAVSAWVEEIRILKSALRPYINRGSVFFEFNIPRMGKRVDVALLIDGIVILLEFKVYADSFDKAAISQVWDYALDMKNFHIPSHGLDIVPILVCTAAKSGGAHHLLFAEDRVCTPLLCNEQDLPGVLDKVLAQAQGHVGYDTHLWERGGYSPTPTIIEAA